MDAPYKGTKEKLNNSYQNNNQDKDLNDDNLSEKANSVQTSYKYHKNKNGANTISSKDSYRNENNHYNNNKLEDDDSLSYEISENSNLICPDCINCTLIEDKKRRENKDRNDDYYGRDNRNDDYGLYDRNRDHDRDLINEKRRQREHNTNEAFQNLARINANLSNKDKLIQMNENSRNPLNEGRPDYQYQRFQDEYNRRQKMINDNLDKYYPNIKNEKPEVASYYDNYVYNPKYNNNRDYGPSNINKKEYIKDLEDQINYKNELKKKEKEEERRRGQQQFEDMQKELKREEEERKMKERKQRDELMKANLELINQKNKAKMKEMEDKLKYRELCDRQNEEYQKELQRKQMEKERMKDDIYNQNKNEYENRQRMKEREKEREKERDYYDNRDGRGYYGTYDDKGRKDKYNDNYGRGFDDGRGGKGYDDGRRGEKGYGDRDNEGRGRKGYEDGRYDNKDNKDHRHKTKERMGRCCRCHKIFPRRLLTINRYFYKENRK